MSKTFTRWLRNLGRLGGNPSERREVPGITTDASHPSLGDSHSR